MNKVINVDDIIKNMDKDCAVRTVISLLGGREHFLKQFALECNIMSERSQEKLKDLEEQEEMLENEDNHETEEK
jgi:hypothetical protein